MDWARELNYEKERGYSIGYDTGLKSAKLEDAANLLKKNISPDIIAECTGLSLTEVEGIKNSLLCTK